jgi:HEAT repeat protein
LLDKLQGHLQQIIIDLSRSDNHDKIQAIKLISKARSKLNEDFAFTILSKLLDDKNKKVRERAQKLINSMKEEHRGAINEIE